MCCECASHFNHTVPQGDTHTHTNSAWDLVQAETDLCRTEPLSTCVQLSVCFCIFLCTCVQHLVRTFLPCFFSTFGLLRPVSFKCEVFECFCANVFDNVQSTSYTYILPSPLLSHSSSSLFFLPQFAFFLFDSFCLCDCAIRNSQILEFNLFSIF